MHAEATRVHPDAEWTIDQLAQRSDVPVRTIREYQSLGLLPAPRRAGRIGLYGAGHHRRLQLIVRLQQRGYSLAAIGDLVTRWRDGASLTDILGLEPDELVHVDEPGAPATLPQLTALLPALVPERLDDVVATGVVEVCGPDRYCIPSPSLLQLTVDALDAGLDGDAVLRLLGALRDAADTVTGAVLDTFGRLPDGADARSVAALASRGRGLLAHGLGRLTLHRIGRTAGITSDDPPEAIIEGLAAARRRPARHRGTRS